MVPGPGRVRAARAGAPEPDGRPAPGREPRADERREGAGAVPPDRADRARRPRRGRLRRTDARARTCCSRTSVRTEWRDRIPAVTHVDGSARIQTVDPGDGAAARRGPPRVRAADRRAGAREHELEHRRTTDRRQPGRRARAVRERPGRPARDRAARRAALGGLRVSGGASRRRDRGAHDRAARRSATLLRSLADEDDEPPRAGRSSSTIGATRPTPIEVPAGVRVLRSCGRGPAAARNVGWRAADATWIAFVDDDVRVTPGWAAALRSDLAWAADDVAGVQGRIVVPLPRDRAATDRERNVHGLERAAWATADMAYRRRRSARRRRLRRALPARLPGGRRPRAPRHGRRAGGSSAAPGA